MQHLWDRLNSPTPAFWRKVRKLGIVCAAVGAPMSAAPAGVHAWVALVGGYLTVAGGVTIALASITCTDSPAAQPPS
jgi:hypothetical protein